MKKRKILILCPYPEDVAPSQRLKFEQYYNAFREAGHELTIRPFVSNAFWKVIYKKGHYLQKAWHTLLGYIERIGDIFRLGRYDVVYIHLWVTPLGPPFFERLVRKFSKKIIFDIDDLVYLKGIQSKATPLISRLKGAGKPIYLMRVADHVITCTPYLDSFVRKLNANTTDISSTVDTVLYKERTDYSLHSGKVVIGWSGSLSTSKYLHLLDDVFRALNDRIDFKLLVIGDPDFSIEGIDVEAMAWSKELEVPVISRFDIGLYPLPDEEWVYGKSGLKAIQYMAMGIPTIATAIGSNFRVMEDAESGFLVRTREEWVQRILDLVHDEQLRRLIGQNARKKVEQYFSIKANTQTYLDIINKVAG